MLRPVAPDFLIPVLVTGFQPRRIRVANDFFRFKESPAPKALGALDSCDKDRNEGEGVAFIVPRKRCTMPPGCLHRRPKLKVRAFG
ncbi:hypothetical protein AJ87_27865 [Rhizobium yanglingense]|nr:hypothetical protein AJ87_27865 [Rhizobium yanglingense]